MSPEQEKSITQAVQTFVLEKLALGLPGHRRPRRQPRSFAVEVLDYEDGVEEPMVTAAGPLELEENGHTSELFLKVIVSLRRTAGFKWEVVVFVQPTSLRMAMTWEPAKKWPPSPMNNDLWL